MKPQMKNPLLPLLLSLLVSTAAFAQQYVPLLEESCRWNEFYQFEAAWNYTVRVAGDTVAEGTAYKKVVVEPDYSLPHMNLLREDTASRRVYHRLWEGNERLLYDFSLAVGDTITIDGVHHVLLSVTDTIPLYCMTSDTVTCSVTPRRVYRLSSPQIYYPVYWIEGVGSLAGLLYPGTAWCGDFKVLCHFDRYGAWDYYHKTHEVGPCEGYVAVPQREMDPGLSAYPNPVAGDAFYIRGSGIARAVVFDAVGRAVNEVFPSGISPCRVDLTGPAGVYTVRITSADGRVSAHKVIKLQ